MLDSEMSRIARRLALVAALALTACNSGEDPCGGATCPFAGVAFAAIEGRVLETDGSPYVAAVPPLVSASVGARTYLVSAPADANSRYRLELNLPWDPGGETVSVLLTAGVPPFVEQTVSVPFSRNRPTRPTTVVDLRRP